ncbi:hypothetical protein E5288_WYG002996 [Bos mutus]|uniref:Uncharacterized protein n=1 Tax=Bos mutus TaxID=72004 RepID=A0A6B0S4N4_9CETA|nr:hypothetical protein [Bos mutus]
MFVQRKLRSHQELHSKDRALQRQLPCQPLCWAWSCVQRTCSPTTGEIAAAKKHPGSQKTPLILKDGESRPWIPMFQNAQMDLGKVSPDVAEGRPGLIQTESSVLPFLHNPDVEIEGPLMSQRKLGFCARSLRGRYSVISVVLLQVSTWGRWGRLNSSDFCMVSATVYDFPQWHDHQEKRSVSS